MKDARLIILPGWGGSKETWEEFVKIAKSSFSFVDVVELPCFGKEPCPTYPWGVSEYADFAYNKISGIKSFNAKADCRVIVLGHSFGGQVATFMMRQYPNSADILLLAAPAVLRKKKGPKQYIFGFIAKLGTAIFSLPGFSFFESKAKKVLYKLSGSTDYMNTSGVQREIFKKVITEDLSEVLRQLKCKGGVIWGTKDTYVPVSNARKIQSLWAGSVVEIIKNGKHGLHHDTKEEFLSAIRRIIASHAK